MHVQKFWALAEARAARLYRHLQQHRWVRPLSIADFDQSDAGLAGASRHLQVVERSAYIQMALGQLTLRRDGHRPTNAAKQASGVIDWGCCPPASFQGWVRQ
jgi:hypothetical protein